MAALFYDPTTNALTVPSQPALTTSALMAQDPARYDRFGNSLESGMSNTFAYPNNDPQAQYQNLVYHFLQEGNNFEKSKQMALDMVDPIVTSESVQNESGDPIDKLQDLYAAQNNAQSNPDRSYRDMSQGAQDARGALASVNTGTSGEPPVLTAGSGSNRLTNLLSGLTYDALGYLTGTSAEAVKANGISLRVDGDEFFAFDGQGNTVPIDAKTAEAIDAANNSSTEQDPAAITGPFMGGYGQESLPALTNPSTDTKAPQTDKGALTAPSKPTQSTVRSTTGGYTGNARGSALPDMQIGLGERLMRMGAAGMAAGGQGGLAQLGAMFGASADVNQANRQAEMEAFGIEEERRQAHAARVAALAASKNKGAGGGDSAKVGDVRMAMAKYQNAIDIFDADTDSSMTGYNPSALFSRFIGRTVGNEDEARRLFLNELRLDSIMERVGETKGAISDAEMRLFASQAPELNSNGIVWKSWLQRQLQMQQIILNRLQTGQRIDPTAPIEETMPNLNTGGGGSTVTVINGMKFTETTPKTAK